MINTNVFCERSRNMLTSKLYEYLESYLPKTLSCAWDKDGLAVLPYENHQTKKVLLAVDVTVNVLDYAKKNGFDTVITHHPSIFNPLPNLTGGDIISKRALYAYKNDISLMAFHTRLDASEYGINMFTAKRMGLVDIVPFSHDGEQIGYVGKFDGGIKFDDALARYKELTGAPCPMYVKANDTVNSALIVCGGYSDGAYHAPKVGADLFLSGDISHHALLDGHDSGVSCIAAGHYYSEKISCECLREILKDTDVEITIYPEESEIKYAL